MTNSKQNIKERIRASNEDVKNGLQPDPWVIEFRLKNNAIKKKWKSKQPKTTYIPKANSGSFFKGMIPKNKLTIEQKEKSLIRAKERVKKWHVENRERVNEQKRNKRLTDPSFKIMGNVRKRLSFLVRRHSSVKTTQTIKYIGCSLDYLLTHLSNQFKEGMSFNNYGDWHIDHIIPCSLFDFTKEDQLYKCFHFTNLQPLWANENRSKSNRITTNGLRLVGFIKV